VISCSRCNGTGFESTEPGSDYEAMCQLLIGPRRRRMDDVCIRCLGTGKVR
jgi:hypothetical protein